MGHGVFWSSAPGTDRSARPYPLPVRVLSFEAEHRELRDPSYSLGPADCYAARLRGRFRGALAAAVPGGDPVATDAEAVYRQAAISALRKRPEFARRLASGHGLAWGKVQDWLARAAPPQEVVGDRFEWARRVVRPALLEILGPEGSGWRTETKPHPERPGASQVLIFLTDTGMSEGNWGVDLDDEAAVQEPVAALAGGLVDATDEHREVRQVYERAHSPSAARRGRGGSPNLPNRYSAAG